MHVVSIYNNKGGEGKSTVTVGVAEFLAANRKKSVLVIDLDAQGSSSLALLGHQSVAQAVASRQTIVDLLGEVRSTRRRLKNVNRFLIGRPASEASNSGLAEIAVMVPNGSAMFDLEEQLNWKKDSKLLLSCLKPVLDDFDYVLIDQPANINQGSVISMNGLVMSDFVLVPIRPTHISLNGLPRTFEMIDHARTLTGSDRPHVIGFLRNATDRRFQQYKANFPSIELATKSGELPTLFDNLWPPSPALESATDENRACNTLKDRFGKSYEHARKVARELEKRCTEHVFDAPQPPVKRTIWERLGLA